MVDIRSPPSSSTDLHYNDNHAYGCKTQGRAGHNAKAMDVIRSRSGYTASD